MSPSTLWNLIPSGRVQQQFEGLIVFFSELTKTQGDVRHQGKRGEKEAKIKASVPFC